MSTKYCFVPEDEAANIRSDMQNLTNLLVAMISNQNTHPLTIDQMTYQFDKVKDLYYKTLAERLSDVREDENGP